MTAQELIEELKKYPPEAYVFFESNEGIYDVNHTHLSEDDNVILWKI